VSGEGPGGLLLVAPRVVRTWTYPPETLEVPVLVTVTKGGGEVDLESVTVDLGSFSAEALCAENLAEGASIAGRLVAGVTPPVRLRPQDGDVIPVTLTAMGRAGSDEVAATETVFQTTAGSTDTFYVVEFLFFDSVSLLYYDVWANPIFVNVP